MPVPLLLFNGECAVCRAIAGWVQTSIAHSAAPAQLTEQPIGDDPAALRALHPGLDIWDAYATIHLLMPDGSMKLGCESCGTQNAWVRSVAAAVTWLRSSFDAAQHPSRTRHRSVSRRRAA